MTKTFTVTAKPVEWEQDSSHQWIDVHYGFVITAEPGDDLPYCATWGESDFEQFASLGQAQAWCQAQVDRWVARYAVVTPSEEPQ